jgi:hypothetical protein
MVTSNIRSTLRATLASLVALLLTACSGGGSGDSPPPAALSITTRALPDAHVGDAYSVELAASGGTPPYTWSLTAGTLPPGLLLNDTSGAISGTPVDGASAVTLTLHAQDAGSPPRSASATLPLTVLASLSITTAALPDGHVGSPYSATLAAAGGQSPYQWSLTAGALPAGLALDAATGALSGTPTANANAALTFQVTDSVRPPAAGSADFSLLVSGALLVITNTSLPDAQVAVPYTTALAYTGGTGAVTWTLTAGTLPAGLALNGTTGVISGSATAPVVQTPLTFQATDAGSPAQTQKAAFGLTVNPSGIAVDVTPHRGGLTLGQALSLTASVNDGAGVSWSVSPAGGTFSAMTSQSGVPVSFTAPASAGVYTVTATSVTDATRSAAVTLGVTDLAGVYTYHGDAARNGANVQEYALTPANVNTTGFGKLFSCTVDGAIYAQPLWVAHLSVAGVTHNVVFVATQHDSLYAFDADASPCQLLWHVSLLDAAHGVGAGELPVLSGGPGQLVGSGYGDITPETGVTGTPVIDPAAQILYVVAKSMTSGGTAFQQRLHAIDLASGSEKAGAPMLITASYPNDRGGSVSFDPKQQTQRAGLALSGSTLYIAWGSYEDSSPWYGWLMGYTYNGMGFAQSAVLNVSPNSGEAGIWMGGGAPAIDSNGHVYVTTGNGQFDGASSSGPRDDYGDSFLQLTPGAGTNGIGVSSFFTPSDQGSNYAGDVDTGSGGAALVLNLGAGPSPQHVLVGGGKDGTLFVLNGDQLGGSGDGNALQKIALGHPIFASSAFWNNTLYIAPAHSAMLAYAFDPTAVRFTVPAASVSPGTYGFPGSTPTVSASGTSSNGIVWGINNQAYCTPQSGSCGPAVLHAYAATTLATELWNSQRIGTDAAGNAVKFTVPTVANGKVYLGTRGNNTGGAGSSSLVPGELEVYGLKPN